MATPMKGTDSALQASFKHTPSAESRRSPRCACLSQSVVLESFIVAFIVISALAITGDNLIRFDLITVPKHDASLADVFGNNNNNSSSNVGSTSDTDDNNNNNSSSIDMSTIPVGINTTSVSAEANNASSENTTLLNISTPTTPTATPSHETPPTAAAAVAGDPAVVTTESSDEVVVVDADVMDILECVFTYTSMGIAGLFFLEILFKYAVAFQELYPRGWQIFDAVVVFLTLGVELAFHYVDLPWDGLYSVKYIVLLRLWRIPYVCDMRARQAQDWLEADVEIYREGQYKAEQRCARMEHNVAQQADIIRQLEAALQAFSNEIVPAPERVYGAHETAPNGRLNQTAMSTRERRNLLRRSRRNKRADVEETEFSHAAGYDDRYHKLVGLDEVSSKEPRGKLYPHLRRDGQSSTENLTDESETPSTVHQIKASSDLPSSHHKPTIKTASPQTSAKDDSVEEYIAVKGFESSDNAARRPGSGNGGLNPGRVPHRSSSEKLTPSFHVTPNSSADNLTPALLVSNDKSSSRVSDESGIGGVDGDLDAEDGHPRKRQSVRRNQSCPEAAYTQRLTLSSEESALFVDEPDSLPIHDNPGFVYTDEESLDVLAEFDGTKTYRSEEGIPMTSL